LKKSVLYPDYRYRCGALCGLRGKSLELKDLFETFGVYEIFEIF